MKNLEKQAYSPDYKDNFESPLPLMTTQTIPFGVKFEGLDGEDPEYVRKNFWYQLDGILGFIEIIDGYDDTFSVPIEKHSAEFRARRKALYHFIASRPGFSSKNLQSAIFNDGKLIIGLRDGKKISINIVEEWNNSLISQKERDLLVQTKEREQKLQEEVGKEAFFGGSVVFEYTKTAAIGAVGVGLAQTAVGLGKTAKDATVSLASMMIKTPKGPQRIAINPPFVGTKTQMSEAASKILESQGLVYDAKTKMVKNPVLQSLTETSENITKISYEDFKKNHPEISLSEAQFQKEKTKILRHIELSAEEVRSGKISSQTALSKIQTKFSGMMFEAFFWPMFFHQARKNQTPVNILSGLSEVAGFQAGLRAAKYVKMPGMAKFFTPLILGGAGVIGSSHLTEALLEKTHAKWKLFQRANYRDTRSAFVHGATGLFILEGLGKFSDTTGKLARKVGIDTSKMSRMDIGLRSGDVSLPVSLPYVGKNISVPEITLFQQKVNFSTPPWEWMKAAAGRTVAEWNSGVDVYRNSATRIVYDILKKYYENSGPFADVKEVANIGGKKKMLESQLYQRLMPEGGDLYAQNVESIIGAVAAEVENLDKNSIPSTNINEAIRINVNAMKLDAIFVENRKRANNFAWNILQSQILEMPELNQKEKTYLISLFERMEKQQPLFVNAEEKAMYSALLNNDTMVSVDGMTMKVSRKISLILDKMAEIQQEKSFFSHVNDSQSAVWNFTSF